MGQKVDVNGVEVWQSLLDVHAQNEILEALRSIAVTAPFRQYTTPSGKKMSVKMSGAGRQSWISDHRGYRYEAQQPNGMSWPQIPDSILSVWEKVSGVDIKPDACLVNFYGEGAKMGMHQDRDEECFEWPVVSISLGDEALFRVGGTSRGGPTQSIWLKSGDVAVLTGASRLAYHGIDRIKFGSSSILSKGGRINVTLRKVTAEGLSPREPA